MSRLSIVLGYFGEFALAAIDTPLLHAYRDERLKTTAPQTVVHELNLVRQVLKWTHLEGGIPLPQGVPMCKMPRLPAGRERRLSDQEIASICQHLSTEQAAMVRFAVETAMRRGEICAMTWPNVDLKRRSVRIPETKNGHPRVIPLSSRAVAILKSLPRHLDGQVWHTSPGALSMAFSRACQKAGIEDARFHDLRHEATSRLFEKGLAIMEVAAITGHKSLGMLQRYTHLSQGHLLEKLG